MTLHSCHCHRHSLVPVRAQSLSLPGYICTILLVDRIGLSPLQKLGFAATAFFFLLLAVLQPYLLQVGRRRSRCVCVQGLYGCCLFARAYLLILMYLGTCVSVYYALCTCVLCSSRHG